MNTQELIQKMAEEFDISANKANKIIHFIVDETKAAVKNEGYAKIAGLGSFIRVNVPTRTVRTPDNGSVTIPAHARPRFRASSLFKDYMK